MSQNPNSLPQDLNLTDKWNTSALRSLVDERCREGRKPSHLFLGRKEGGLLRDHLGEAFGSDSVSTFNDLYFMFQAMHIYCIDQCFKRFYFKVFRGTGIK